MKKHFYLLVKNTTSEGELGFSKSLGSVPNGANLRVIWDNFISVFLIARAVTDFDHLVTRNIEQLMGLRSSFDGSGFSPERSIWNLVFGN